jgi:hypothetical protein
MSHNSPRTTLVDRWREAALRALNLAIDDAQRQNDGATIRAAGALVERVESAHAGLMEIEDALAGLGLEGVAAHTPIVTVEESEAAAPTTLPAGESSVSAMRPPSFLLLPAGGDASGRHFRDTVLRRLDPARIDDWLPGQGEAIRARIGDGLAAWGLRDNTRLNVGSGRKPLIWDRIVDGTLALFSDGDRYVRAARVIGKGTSDVATSELWHSPDFRWLVLLTDVREVRIPIGTAIAGAGFQADYRINRQALVPKPHREPGLWRAIEPYLRGHRA